MIENTGRTIATSHITHLYLDLKGFFHPNPQRPATTAQPVHVKINHQMGSHQVRPQLSHVKGVLQVTELNLVNSSRYRYQGSSSG